MSTENYNTGAREEIFSKAVRAGKRTYFFDVKSTRNSDYYITITESKKNTDEDGKFTYEKHKIFVYKEDFLKFMNGYQEAFEKINSLTGNEETEYIHKPKEDTTPKTEGSESTTTHDGSDVHFDF